MLYYVLVRSESPELMQYNLLVELLDNLIQTQSRAASAQRKNRPESSSPEKLKMRNPQKTAQGSGKQTTSNEPTNNKGDNNSEDNNEKESKDGDANQEEEDNYSDEEIANDPDDGDDGTKELMNVNKNKAQLLNRHHADEDEDADEKYSDDNEDD